MIRLRMTIVVSLVLLLILAACAPGLDNFITITKLDTTKIEWECYQPSVTLFLVKLVKDVGDIDIKVFESTTEATGLTWNIEPGIYKLTISGKEDGAKYYKWCFYASQVKIE